jgi:hypothetical protein
MTESAPLINEKIFPSISLLTIIVILLLSLEKET